MTPNPSQAPPRCSIAAVIRRPEAAEEFLIVRRPLDDDSLPGAWGLPAVTLRPGELPESAVRRIGAEKLGVEIEPTRFLGVEYADRGPYRLVLMDIEARVRAGHPDVGAASGVGTRYVDARWTADLETLRPAAREGSLCCAILLQQAGSP